MLTTKQRAALRSQSNSLPDSVIIGKGGLTPTVLGELDTALYHRELIKVSVLKNCEADIRCMAFPTKRVSSTSNTEISNKKGTAAAVLFLQSFGRRRVVESGVEARVNEKQKQQCARYQIIQPEKCQKRRENQKHGRH